MTEDGDIAMILESQRNTLSELSLIKKEITLIKTAQAVAVTAEAIVPQAVSKSKHDSALSVCISSSEALNDATCELKEIFDTCGENWKKYEDRIVHGLHLVENILIGGWQGEEWDDKSINRLFLSLQRTISLACTYKSDHDTLWIILPIQRLVAEIMYTFCFYLLSPLVMPSREERIVRGSHINPAMGAGVCLNENNHSSTQVWALEPHMPSINSGETRYYITSQYSGHVLEVERGKQTVWAWFVKKGTAEQLWVLTKRGHLKSTLNNHVLDIRPGNRSTQQLVLRSLQDDSQIWKLSEDGVLCATKINMVLDITRGVDKRKVTEKLHTDSVSKVSNDTQEHNGSQSEKHEKSVQKKMLLRKLLLTKQASSQPGGLLDTLELHMTSSLQTVYTLMVLDCISCLRSMLTDHKKEIASGGIQVVKGAIKSVLTRNIDEDLRNGLVKCVSAGFEVYKHFEAEKQLQMIRQMRTPINASLNPFYITYDELLVSSQCMQAVDGNWLLSSNYLSHVTRASLCAIRLFPHDQAGAAAILRGSLVGDSAMTGIIGIFRKVHRKRSKRPSDGVRSLLHTTLLDGQCLASTLRQVLMEAMGEMTESVQHVVIDRIDNCLSIANDYTADKLKYLQDSMTDMVCWTETMNKSLSKLQRHLKGASKVISSLIQYMKVFSDDMNSDDIFEIARQLASSCKIEDLNFVNVFKLLNIRTTENNVTTVLTLVYIVQGMVDDILLSTDELLKEMNCVPLQNAAKNLEKVNYRGGVLSQGMKLIGFSSNGTELDYVDAIETAKSVLPRLKKFFHYATLTLQHNCAVFRFGIEVISKIEDLFDEVLLCRTDDLSSSGVIVTSVEARIRNTIKPSVRKIMGSLKHCGGADAYVSGWWSNISEVWDHCAFSESMGAIRKVMPTIVGPGEFPDRVEEAAVFSLLEIEKSLGLLMQFCEGNDTFDHQAVDQLRLLLDSVLTSIATAKASSPSDNVQLLLSQDSYREKVKYALQETWQDIEDVVMVNHMQNFQEQECLREDMETLSRNKTLSKSTAFIDTIDHYLGVNDNVRTVKASIVACEDLLHGKSGVSGLARGLITSLKRLKRNFESSERRIQEIVSLSDDRWGISASWGAQPYSMHMHQYYFTSLPSRVEQSHCPYTCSHCGKHMSPPPDDGNDYCGGDGGERPKYWDGRRRRNSRGNLHEPRRPKEPPYCETAKTSEGLLGGIPPYNPGGIKFTRAKRFFDDPKDEKFATEIINRQEVDMIRQYAK
mmetsp:Transcript_11010/g.16783  ORF Transcript_11010/g.16783 Transcript_11010/m.16783 type:complete len:1247 (-) Transcript_11010:278-4018(-)|eukprot:CAMPEP_0185021512 /NCGR_PEP_ID=MMETSP1103-20130426/4198_1 /TAXON_ID=36769 /ORGANISM="Paraphysomonas bandaiensis, Strain Caron Lab Isolate" /LENGTH=1246 /DNA_ID=CAMNT_0027553077 /DNA_START=1144 /DNA_END=4884 /DNA_ORIENTATION=-